MFYTDFVCTMNFLHHRGGGVNCILTAPIKVPWCELLGLFLKKIIHLSVLLHMYPQKTWVRAGKVTRDAFVWLFSTVCFQMLTQQPCLRRCKVTLVAFVCFFLHCVLSNVPSKRLPKRRHSHIDCICLTFLHCVFLNVPSKCLNKRMQSHIGCICFTLCIFKCCLKWPA